MPLYIFTIFLSPPLPISNLALCRVPEFSKYAEAPLVCTAYLNTRSDPRLDIYQRLF